MSNPAPKTLSTIIPGFGMATLFGALSYGLSIATGFPVMILAILFGLVLHRFYSQRTLKPGVDWTAKPLLNIAVALLGLRIEMSVIAEHGALFPLIALVILVLTILIGYAIGRIFKLGNAFSILMAGAVAVCGVSAAAAIASVMPDNKNRANHLALTIGGVTLLSTAAMIIYPLLTHIMNMNDTQSGVVMGASIHNVSQAVGAGYAVSDEAGNIATIIKLLRVSLLLPVVLIISLIWSRRSDGASSWKTYFPPFLIAFFILAALNAFNVLPIVVTQIGSEAAHWFLIISMVAIGMKTNMGEIIKIGPKPLVVMTLTTVIMFGLAMAFVLGLTL